MQTALSKTQRVTLAACVLAGTGFLAIAGCSKAPPAAPAAATVDAGFLADNAAWRKQRSEDLTKPDGWTSLIGLHWIELKAHFVGSSADSGMRLAMGPPKLGLLQQDGGRIYFTPEQGSQITLDGKPLAGRAELHDDQSDKPSVIGFDGDKGRITLIERGGRHALRVKDADAETRTGYAGLDYWPADPGWKVQGTFVPNPAGKTIPVVDIIGVTNDVPNPGAVVFQRDGKPYRIEALDEGDGTLFLVFADRTNGHGSYGAGRFLDAPKPDANGKVALDFNRAYNPPCAFTPFATCPLPPPENRLNLAVTAGEKQYAKAEH